MTGKMAGFSLAWLSAWEQSQSTGVSKGMRGKENSVTRRYVSILMLAILMGANAAPLAASGRHCAMQRPAPSGVCARCDLAGGSSREASLSAGSCCRFEAATPRTLAPGIAPGSQRPHDDVSLLAVLAVESQFGISAPGRSETDLPQPRSTDSPLALHNILRL